MFKRNITYTEYQILKIRYKFIKIITANDNEAVVFVWK